MEEIGHITCLEYRIAVPSGYRGSPGHLDLRLFHIDAVQLSGFHGFGEPHRDRSGTASEVENAVASLKVWEQMRGINLRVPAVEQFLELVTVTHGVGGRGSIRGLVVIH